MNEQAADVEFYNADVAIATGNRTGDAIPHSEIDAIRAGTRLPVIGGSGMTADNAGSIMKVLDGAIVGSSLKRDGVWWKPVEQGRVKTLVDTVATLREVKQTDRVRVEVVSRLQTRLPIIQSQMTSSRATDLLHPVEHVSDLRVYDRVQIPQCSFDGSGSPRPGVSNVTCASEC